MKKYLIVFAAAILAFVGIFPWGNHDGWKKTESGLRDGELYEAYEKVVKDTLFTKQIWKNHSSATGVKYDDSDFYYTIVLLTKEYDGVKINEWTKIFTGEDVVVERDTTYTPNSLRSSM